MKHFIIGGTRN